MRYSFIIYALLFATYINSQITIKTNLPSEVNYRSEITFEVKIQKGPLKNFTKYQMSVPSGALIKESESNTGSFSFEENLVKIIWAITPPQNEFSFTMKLVTGNLTGEIALNQKYFYLEKGEKKEITIAPVYVNVKDSLASFEVKTANLNVADPFLAQLQDSSHDALIHGVHSPEEMKLQVLQLKKDSKEAIEIGAQEKTAAQQRLAAANTALKEAETLTNKNERKLALENANLAKEKAQSDLDVANRILTLAKLLDDDAIEIEKLNQSLDSLNISYKDSENPSSDTKTERTPETNAKNKAETRIKIEKIEKARQAAIAKGKKNARDLYKPFTWDNQNFAGLKQQIAQLKKDSKDALAVGDLEKKKAELKLEGAYADIKKAEYIKDEEEKKIALEKAGLAKQSAENDLEIASKIITLAKSLDDNAREIEKLNITTYSVDTVANIISKAAPSVTAETTVIESIKKETVVKTESHKDVDKLHEIFKATPEKEVARTKLDAIVDNSKGLAYRIQIGAFDKKPDKTQFTSLGKVDVILENGKYKALLGSFATREEASKRKQEIINKGFDGFIVSYQDGVKVK